MIMSLEKTKMKEWLKQKKCRNFKNNIAKKIKTIYNKE